MRTVIGSLLACSVNGWGQLGHTISATLAEGFLTESTESFISAHLNPGERLADVSMWADSVPWADNLHFAFTHPYRDCRAEGFTLDESHCRGGRCIITAISNYTERAGRDDLSREARAEAVKFLVHLYADIHHPLHLGFEQDHGGCDIELPNYSRSGQITSLHEFWDTNLVEKAGKDASAAKKGKATLSVESFVNSLRDEYTEWEPELKTTLGVLDPLAIAQETSSQITCDKAYKNESGMFMDPDNAVFSSKYTISRAKIVRVQLIKSAVRMAAAINEIATVYRSRVRIPEPVRGVYQPPAPPSIPGMEYTNRFAELVECDIEDLVEDEDKAASDPVIAAPVVVDRAPKKKSSKQRKPAAVPIIDDSSDASQFAHVVLIKRRGSYFVTQRRLVGSRNYFPEFSHSYWIMFRSSGEVEHKLISWDCAAFGSPPPTPATISRTMLHLQQKRADVAGNLQVTPSGGVYGSNSSFLPRGMTGALESTRPRISDAELASGRVQVSAVAPPAFMGLEKSHQSEVARLRATIPTAKIVVFSSDCLFIIGADSLQRPMSESMIFNRHKIISSAGISMIFIDRYVFDAAIDRDVDALLAAHIAPLDPIQDTDKRPTIVQELSLVRKVFRQNEFDRAFISTRFSKFLAIPDCEEANYLQVEWRPNLVQMYRDMSP
jgi:hypothetical protein